MLDAQASVHEARLRRSAAAGLLDAILRRQRCRRRAAGDHHRPRDAVAWLDRGQASL